MSFRICRGGVMSGTELGIPFPKRKIPWEREKASKYISPAVEYYVHNLARKHPKFRQKLDNKFLDLPTKRAAMEASASVVALVSFIDGKREKSLFKDILEPLLRLMVP
ncbi:hypothetical protein POM88_054898 [Heracleum sosnowskyi]|uniref:Uncharacterized protein n=1 Tax=Heracleum sosnowskyi TaxID=360622 RepID=A0AAD8GMC8_9APIA|nr:hypothetical protein POM88_054898 [Heracleum sosnowskyi]